MFTHYISTPVPIVAVLLFAAIPVSSLMIPRPPRSLPDAGPRIRRQIGNMNAASDLYGIGIRTGAYLQILGMLLSCGREQNRSRVGIKLLSSALCLTILLSWTVLVCGQSLSPCEAWLVLSLANAYATPRSAAMKHPDSKTHKGGVALLFALLSTVWQNVSLMWFFSTLVLQLPTLDTKNLVWFFTAVDVSGWFRIVMLCYSTVYCLFLPVEIIEYLGLLRRTFVDWAGVKNADNHRERSCKWAPLMRNIARVVRRLEDNRVSKKVYEWTDSFCEWVLGMTDDMEIEDREEKLRKFQQNSRRFWVILGVVTLVLTIAGIEKTIDYNDLSPQNDLSQPGQAIPFILGIITVIEGLASACKPEAPSLPVTESDSDTDVPFRGEPVNTPASSSSWWKVWLPGKEGDVTSSSRKEETEATSVQ